MIDFDLLRVHKSIGWDIDGTLIDGPQSWYVREFIADTPNKRHCLVTFRTGWMVKDIPKDLALNGLDHKDFEIYAMDDDVLFTNWRRIRKLKEAGLVLSSSDLCWQEDFLTWKGYTCYINNLTALVDDRPDYVEYGCNIYNVAFFPCVGR